MGGQDTRYVLCFIGTFVLLQRKICSHCTGGWFFCKLLVTYCLVIRFAMCLRSATAATPVQSCQCTYRCEQNMHLANSVNNMHLFTLAKHITQPYHHQLAQNCIPKSTTVSHLAAQTTPQRTKERLDVCM